MKDPIDTDDPRTFVRRLLLAEILAPHGEPGALSAPSVRQLRTARTRNHWSVRRRPGRGAARGKP